MAQRHAETTQWVTHVQRVIVQLSSIDPDTALRAPDGEPTLAVSQTLQARAQIERGRKKKQTLHRSRLALGIQRRDEAPNRGANEAQRPAVGRQSAHGILQLAQGSRQCPRRVRRRLLSRLERDIM